MGLEKSSPAPKMNPFAMGNRDLAPRPRPGGPRKAPVPRKIAPKGATEQPGNSFKYLYWRLSKEAFQQMCGALLRRKFDPVQCYPVGMADGGIDAVSNGSIVYQVKWTSKFEQNPTQWLKDVIDGERENILTLVREKNISRYILMTSVAGTTTAHGTGSMQKLQKALDTYSREFGIRVECWWQADLDAEVDLAPDALKWSYQEMLAGADAIRYLIQGATAQGAAHQMRETLLKVMASQWRDDSKIKFSQLDMDRVNISDLFIDVQVKRLGQPAATTGHPLTEKDSIAVSTGAVKYMLDSIYPLTYLLGVPGQGKSTLGQYLCQIHRAAVLPELAESTALPTTDEPKLPLRVDLTDYSSWISGRDPFAEDEHVDKTRHRRREQRSFELFLSLFCSFHSGGRVVTVEQVQSLLDRYPTLLVLDGLDEVADSRLRGTVVDEINRFASRMGTAGERRRFQILVTSRPNASSLPEPDKHMFQTLELCPLSVELQSEFVSRWASLNEIAGSDRSRLQRTFQERTAYDHVAQLADNPMQLTILLFLINRKGEAVPISRTPLYTEYMATLLDREVSNQQIERDHVPHVTEVTAFLGWHMQSGVESERTAGRMSLEDIEDTLVVYFRRTDGPADRAEELFKTVTHRFWALTSKLEGTFEFSVQPVREYFAAKFLAEWAGQDRRDPLPKAEVLRQLIKRNYWLNTARFYAGFANPNELAGLRYGLEDAIGLAQHPLQERVAVWTLLSDGIFANKESVQRDVAGLLTDDLTVRLATDDMSASTNFPRLGGAAGGDSLATALLRDISSNPGQDISLARVSMLRKHALIDPKAFSTWWNARADAALGTAVEADWLSIGAQFGGARLSALQSDRLALDSPRACRAALSIGASPSDGAPQRERLLHAVLDGSCSESEALGSGEAGNLLRAMRPYWFIRLAEAGKEGAAIPTNHFWLGYPKSTYRSDAFKALMQIDTRYGRLQQAARTQAMGQKGTTEPWQNAARELARIHGACWLTADIAVIGAATRDTRGEGSIDRNGVPFGPNVDYGTLVVELHRRPASEWWQLNFETYRDSLSRRTWAFALLATADESIVQHHLANLESVVSAATADDFHSLAASSGRLGATSIPRRLGPSILAAATGLSIRLSQLMTHFVSQLGGPDPLAPLSNEILAQMADSEPHNWAVARAISTRLQDRSDRHLLRGLALLGQDAPVEISYVDGEIGEGVAAAILKDPSPYPAAWVRAAERRRSTAHREKLLADEALANGWVPKVPRI